MRFVLGSESEGMEFLSDGIEYRPDGLHHAVDTAGPEYRTGQVVAYAVCGRAVRVWVETAFDDDAADPPAHDDCVELAAGVDESQAEVDATA